MAKHVLNNTGARVVTLNVEIGGKVRPIKLLPKKNVLSEEEWQAIDAARKGGGERKPNKALAAMFEVAAKNVATQFGPGHLVYEGVLKGTENEKTDGEDGGKKEAGADGKRTDADAALADVSVEDALSLIEDTVNVDELRAWKRGEAAGRKRKKVLEALDAQVEKILATPPKK